MSIARFVAAAALAASIVAAARPAAADEVLKDADLDLAFIRPREPQKLGAVELKSRGRAPELLEEVFTITRLGRVEARAAAVLTGSVKSIVKGPRTFYACTLDVSAGNQ